MGWLFGSALTLGTSPGASKQAAAFGGSVCSPSLPFETCFLNDLLLGCTAQLLTQSPTAFVFAPAFLWVHHSKELRSVTRVLKITPNTDSCVRSGLNTSWFFINEKRRQQEGTNLGKQSESTGCFLVASLFLGGLQTAPTE